MEKTLYSINEIEELAKGDSELFFADAGKSPFLNFYWFREEGKRLTFYNQGKFSSDIEREIATMFDAPVLDEPKWMILTIADIRKSASGKNFEVSPEITAYIQAHAR